MPKVRDTTYLKIVTSSGASKTYHSNFYANDSIRFGTSYDNVFDTKALNASASSSIDIRFGGGGNLVYTDESNNAVPNGYSIYIVY